MSKTPICDSQKYSVVQKDNGQLLAVIPLEVAERLEQEVARLQEALEKIQTLGLYPEDMLDICNQTLAKEQKPAGLPDTPGAALALIRSGYIKKIQEENIALRAALIRALPALEEHAEDETAFWGSMSHPIAKDAIEVFEQAKAALSNAS